MKITQQAKTITNRIRRIPKTYDLLFGFQTVWRRNIVQNEILSRFPCILAAIMLVVGLTSGESSAASKKKIKPQATVEDGLLGVTFNTPFEEAKKKLQRDYPSLLKVSEDILILGDLSAVATNTSFDKTFKLSRIPTEIRLKFKNNKFDSYEITTFRWQFPEYVMQQGEREFDIDLHTVDSLVEMLFKKYGSPIYASYEEYSKLEKYAFYCRRNAVLGSWITESHQIYIGASPRNVGIGAGPPLWLVTANRNNDDSWKDDYIIQSESGLVCLGYR